MLAHGNEYAQTGMMDEVEWISAWEATTYLYRVRPHARWREIIYERLAEGFIRSKADRYVFGNNSNTDEILDRKFWGKDSQLKEAHWDSGDFERRLHAGNIAKAFGVKFAKLDIIALVGGQPLTNTSSVVPQVPQNNRPVNARRGGRPLEYAHSEAAAAVAIKLIGLDDWKERPITQAVVQSELRVAYERLGRLPESDTIEKAAQGVWRALNAARGQDKA
jgi:hypothetical protein